MEESGNGTLLNAGESGDGRERREWIWLVLLAGVFAIALAWRWHFASEARIYTYDSYYYMVLARNLRQGLHYSVAGHPHFKFMPLYPITIALLNLFTGNLEFAGKFTNVLFASACVFPVYAIGKLIFSHRAGLAAALLFAVEPVTVAWSAAPMSEGLFTLLICLAALFFLSWMKKGGTRKLYLCAGATGLALVTRWEGFLFLGFLGIFLLAYWWKGRLKISHLAIFSAIALVPFALLVLRNLVAFGTPIKSAYIDEMNVHPEQFELMDAWGRFSRYLIFSDVDPIGISGMLYHYGYLVFGYLGLGVALAVKRTRPYAFFITLWLLVMGPLHYLWYFLSLRFTFPAVPALCLGAGALLGIPWGEDIWRDRTRRSAAVFLSLLALAVILALGLSGRSVTNDIFTRNMRWLEDDVGGLAVKDAMLWLKDNAGEEEVASNVGPIASFYLGRDVLFLGGWQDFEPADIRPDHLLEDAREKGVRYIVVYAWEPDPRVALDYADIDPDLLSELELVRIFHVRPLIDANRDVYAWVFEIPGVGGAP